MADLWSFLDEAWTSTDLVGFEVEAEDGRIGHVASFSADPNNSALIIDTGPWIFGRKVVLPAGLVERVDFDSSTVFVTATRDEIKDAPEIDQLSDWPNEPQREEIDIYYGSRCTKRAEGYGGEPDAW